MSHTVIVEFHCAPGQGAAFLETLLPSLADTRSYEGCQSVETYVDQDAPDTVLLWEKWDTRPNQETYLAWRAETGMLDAIGPFMAAPPRIAHFGTPID